MESIHRPADEDVVSLRKRPREEDLSEKIHITTDSGILNCFQESKSKKRAPAQSMKITDYFKSPLKQIADDQETSYTTKTRAPEPNKSQTSVCPECGNVFRTKSGMRRHRKVKHQYHRYDCADCGIQYTASWTLKQHRMQCPGLRKTVTKTLSTEIQDTNQIIEIKKAANRNIDQDCCNDAGATNPHPRDHLQQFQILDVKKRDSNLENISCPLCWKYFTRVYRLKEHIIRHESRAKEIALNTNASENLLLKFKKNEPCANQAEIYKVDHLPLYQCKVCSETEFLEINMIAHVRLHLELIISYDTNLSAKWRRTVSSDQKENKRKHKVEGEGNGTTSDISDDFILKVLVKLQPTEETNCQICGKHFKNYSQLERHIVSHTKEKRHVCNICCKRLSTKRTLNRHIFQMHTMAEKTLKCTVCDRGFFEKNCLENHMNTHLEREQYKFICEFCERKFHSKYLLDVHSRTHTKEKPFTCKTCGRSFGQQGSLIRHNKIHTGLTPFKCMICEKQFKQKCTLDRHIRVHTKEKPYVCTFCGDTFAQNTGLQLHTRIHTQEKPYPCELCEKKFSRKESLKSHMNIHAKQMI